jgi:ATP-dependent RNA helicase RhlE
LKKNKYLNTFDSMELFPKLQRALNEQGYEQPTPIQAQTIPAAIAGRDVLGCAQTGTGKTAAFALPILDYLGNERPPARPNRPTTLVLAPTRELAIQISESFRVYGKHIRFREALVYGGVRQEGQVRAIRRGVDVLIATPGRLLDLMQQGHIDLGSVEFFVLDEADRMLDMGFLPALEKIISELPSHRQSLFFSATLPPKIRKLASELLFNPISIDVTPKSSSLEGIEQVVKFVQRDKKMTSLQKLLGGESVDRVIVFTRTKHGANGLTRKIEKAGFRAAAIHGNKTQNARQKALEAFRRKKVQVLVATDVAARGIDIAGVTHVVNYDMPVDPESYVHRIGRTGRAGAEGTAVSFCTPDECDELRAIEKLTGKRLTVENPESDFRSSSSSSKTRKTGYRKSFRGNPRARNSNRGRQDRRSSGRGKKTGASNRAGRQKAAAN